MIICRSPLRVSLGGGGTDLPSYYQEHGGFVIAAAIDKYVFITLHETFQKQLEAVKAGGVKFYWLGAGTTDMAREGTVNLSELVKKQGFPTSYREIPGRHYWFLWRDFLAQYAQVAFQPQAQP